MKQSKGVKNILKVYKSASEEQKKLGMSAYQDYYRELKAMAEFFELPFKSVVAAFAAISPGNRIEENFKDTLTLIEGMKANKDLSRIKKLHCYPQCTERAYNYLFDSEAFESRKGKKGLKTWNFYFNILHPFSPDYVTIDRHAIRIWCGGKADCEKFEKSVFDSPNKYKAIAEDYKQAAKIANILPCEMQAITWYAWR